MGAICVAVNPYVRLDMYTVPMQAQYGKMMRHELPPHVYSTSAAAYRGLSQFSKKQSILVSGESGAGENKTLRGCLYFDMVNWRAVYNNRLL